MPNLQHLQVYRAPHSLSSSQLHSPPGKRQMHQSCRCLSSSQTGEGRPRERAAKRMLARARSLAACSLHADVMPRISGWKSGLGTGAGDPSLPSLPNAQRRTRMLILLPPPARSGRQWTDLLTFPRRLLPKVLPNCIFDGRHETAEI